MTSKEFTRFIEEITSALRPEEISGKSFCLCQSPLWGRHYALTRIFETLNRKEYGGLKDKINEWGRLLDFPEYRELNPNTVLKGCLTIERLIEELKGILAYRVGDSNKSSL